MHIPRLLCAWLVLFGLTTAHVQANWMTFTGGPTTATGTWPGGSQLSGTATVTASNFVNGNASTPAIGITPQSVTNLSADYLATGLQPNSGSVVTGIGTPYNDSGDTYHVKIDFSGTTSSSTSGVLPAGSVFSIVDLDLSEVYLFIKATDASNNPITTGWIGGPSNWFDMTNAMIPVGSLGPPPNFNVFGPGVYNAAGIGWNFDIGMWLFNTTQDVKTIEFDMAKFNGGNGGGGAGWAFYSPASQIVPEPSCIALVACGLFIAFGRTVRPRR
jgi:hypothetical protein